MIRNFRVFKISNHSKKKKPTKQTNKNKNKTKRHSGSECIFKIFITGLQMPIEASFKII